MSSIYDFGGDEKMRVNRRDFLRVTISTILVAVLPMPALAGFVRVPKVERTVPPYQFSVLSSVSSSLVEDTN